MMYTDHQGAAERQFSGDTPGTREEEAWLQGVSPENRPLAIRDPAGMLESWFQPNPHRLGWGTPLVHKSVHQASSILINKNSLETIIGYWTEQTQLKYLGTCLCALNFLKKCQIQVNCKFISPAQKYTNANNESLLLVIFYMLYIFYQYNVFFFNILE